MDEKKVASRFDCTSRDRAVFEAGIKLGAVCHQFSGVPVSAENVKSIESAMKNTLAGMPYVRTAKVRINHDFPDNDDHYGMIPLTEGMMDVIVVVKVEDVEVTAEMRYDSGLKYPLMYVSNVS